MQGEGTPHGEIDRQYLDSTAIREELGWEPRWELERGLARGLGVVRAPLRLIAPVESGAGTFDNRP